MTHLDHKFVAPKKYSLTAFPAATDQPAGMKILNEATTPVYPRIIADVPYAQRGNLTLHLQIIMPPNATTSSQKFPLLMYVPGSAFHKQNVGEHLVHLAKIAKLGYVIAVVEYRWAPDDPFPAQIIDFHTATRFMLAHANRYHVDATKYLAWGDSSGAHTIVMGALTTQLSDFNAEEPSKQPLAYQGVIDFYGPTDISRMNAVPSTQDHTSAHSLEGEFFGSHNLNEIPEQVQKANPITYITDQKLPPFLIMHGNKDRLVPFEQSVLLYNALQAHHQSVDFYRLTGSDHGTDAFFTPHCLSIVHNFIQSVFN
ncbi:alpha/beta hydrolase fold domain-containing protein [Pediococcus siamensis]|uniref:alpha/beta hydrolase fold domain-containing protein n=1 Tax=Pediococcus siamensis TaxID=381829 RepID=UPI0039A03F5A